MLGLAYRQIAVLALGVLAIIPARRVGSRAMRSKQLPSPFHSAMQPSLTAILEPTRGGASTGQATPMVRQRRYSTNRRSLVAGPGYTPGFRVEAVKLVEAEGLSIGRAAQRLSVPKRSLSNWVRAAQAG
jgi:hypothetical protein